MTDESVAARIRRHREARGLTRPQLAGLVGVSAATISDWERGRVTPVGEHRLTLVEALSGKGVDEVVTLHELWPVADTADALYPPSVALLRIAVRTGTRMLFTTNTAQAADAADQLVAYYCAAWVRRRDHADHYYLTPYGEDVREHVDRWRACGA